MRHSILALVAILLGGFPSHAQKPVSPHARQAWQTIRELRSIGLPEDNQFENGPPPRVPGLLRELNRQLRDLIVDSLNDSSLRTVPGEDDITEQLRAVGWDEVADNKWNAYGEIIRISYDFKPGYEPGLLVVSTQLWIPCGSSDPDASIYVFRGRARHWDLVLVTDADFDSGFEDAGGMRYQLSPPDQKGLWYLAVANTPPECRPTVHRSPQSVLRFKVLRPGKSPDEPVTVMASREPIDPTFNPAFRLRAEEDWFAVTTGKVRKLDGEKGVSIARYQVIGDRARRIQPLALSADDFLDEWSRLPWDEAVRWTGAAKRSQLQEWHSKINSFAFDSTELQHVYSCRRLGSGSTVLIDLWIDHKLNPSIRDEHLYALIASRDGAFYVDSIETSRPSGCEVESALHQLNTKELPDW